ncbi:MAG: sulfite reductase subunit A [Ignavibacteria bacterium]|nr:sulfite reductase subunit A [Ignavibacteria bacterium]
MMNNKLIIERKNFEALLSALCQRGFTIIAPVLRENAIVYDEVTSSNELPIGWTDEQTPATYRLKKRNDNAVFGYVVGPHSWKKYLFPPHLKLFSAEKNGKGFVIEENHQQFTIPKYAFVGVRACELNAIQIQDNVFCNGQYVDANYKSQREKIFIVAVNCVQSGGNCFCTSMKTGPKVENNFDIALTEIVNEKEHYFIAEVGSEKGKVLLSEIPHREAEQKEMEKANQLVEQTANQMKRSLDTTNIKQFLYDNFDNPHWDEVALRCLNCANCTMACPTCFCTTVEDVTDLTGEHTERWRKWDSCFTMEFSYIHGGSIRASAKSRYRQWLTHKLSSWIDQFGTSGCVGCGRCITWCPVGIDITEEVKAMQHSKFSTTKK